MDVLVVLGTIGLVAVAIVAGRWLDRRLHVELEPVDRPALPPAKAPPDGPGETAATARAESGAARARLLAELRCAGCGGETTAGPALPVILDGAHLEVVTAFCGTCGAKRAIYFARS